MFYSTRCTVAQHALLLFSTDRLNQFVSACHRIDSEAGVDRAIVDKLWCAFRRPSWSLSDWLQRWNVLAVMPATSQSFDCLAPAYRASLTNLTISHRSSITMSCRRRFPRSRRLFWSTNKAAVSASALSLRFSSLFKSLIPCFKRSETG